MKRGAARDPIDPVLATLARASLNTSEEALQRMIEENTVRVGAIINSLPLDRDVRIYKCHEGHHLNKIDKNTTPGIKRVLRDGILVLELTGALPEFLPIFLLKEIYLRFVPFKIKDFKIIHVFIDHLVQDDLSHLSITKKWNDAVKKAIIDKDLLQGQLDRIERFFVKQEGASSSNPRAFFFEYIRRNVEEIKEGDTEFYEKLFQSYMLEGRLSLRDVDVLKTIRDVFIIFNQVKSYKNLLDYKRYFQEFKKSGVLKTDLSLTKFADNMKWISEFTHLAPNYTIKWEAVNFTSIGCLLVFHPSLKTSRVTKIVTSFPFFTFFKYSMAHFSTHVFGFFVMPRVYKNDLETLLLQMKANGWLLDFNLLSRTYQHTGLNLNYFDPNFEGGHLTSPLEDGYQEDMLLISTVSTSDLGTRSNLSLLDFLILDRVRYYSVSGLPFERRSETARLLKEDFSKRALSEARQFSLFKKNLYTITLDPFLVGELIAIMDLNFQAGYFRVRDFIGDLVLIREELHSQIAQYHSINNSNDLLDFLKENPVMGSFQVSRLLKNESVKRLVLKDLALLFTSRGSHESDLAKKTDRYRLFMEFLDSCHGINIIDNDTIRSLVTNATFAKHFIDYKQEEFKIKYKKSLLLELTSESLEGMIEDFTTGSPAIMFPCLITTIATTPFMSKTYYVLIVKDAGEEVLGPAISEVLSCVPRSNVMGGEENGLVYLDFYLPTIEKSEKLLLFFAIHDLFGERILYFKRLFTAGFIEPLDLSNHHDFIKKEYRHSKVLFPHFLKLASILLPEKKGLLSRPKDMSKLFTLPRASFQDLVNAVKKRVAREVREFDFYELSMLQDFHDDLHDVMTGMKKCPGLPHASFFKMLVDKISFLPDFSAFGLSQFILYIRPIDPGAIDFKLLLANTFQKIESTATFDETPAFMIKYLFPFDNANKSYINRIVKADRNASEYCFFSVEKVHHRLHFEKNLSSRGWDTANEISELFRIHARSFLFGLRRKETEINVKSFSFSNARGIDVHGSDSEEFSKLTDLYSRGARNLKKFMNESNLARKLDMLAEKGLLFFYLRVKNLDLRERMTIILPGVDEKWNEPLLRIFSFFNYFFAFEIKGEYYTKDEQNKSVINFKNGLMIKLRLPPLELSSIQETLIEIFEVLGIERYLILTDIISLDFIKDQLFSPEELEGYNPLKTLTWNERHKKWDNVRLFGEDVTEKIYPSLR